VEQARLSGPQEPIGDTLVQGFVDNGAHDLGSDAVKVKFGKRDVLMVVNAIPDALSVGAACETICRPSLRDHNLGPDRPSARSTSSAVTARR
jgi:hypothetical protein